VVVEEESWIAGVFIVALTPWEESNLLFDYC
jgi:hypothetical protein